MSARTKKVKVWVRTRPTSNFAHGMIDLQKDGKTINIHCKRDAKKGVVNNQILDWSFKMDGLLHNANQEQVQDTCARDMVSAALDGYNGTLMCYGQTGAGKTFTVTGATENYKHRGVIPRSLSQIFREIDDRPESAISVRVSYLEIYNETMFDLLSTLPESNNPISPMAVVEDQHGVYVKGLSCHLAQNEEDALNLLFEGEMNRAIAEHSLNKVSSRSHCIFTVYIENRSRVQSDAKYTISKINFVDLAGSERLSKTKSEGKTQQEAMYINKSLTFLEQTIIALADKRREHIPFRQTKLTHYLKDSIGGNCRTILVANIWGEAAQIEETISTLRFATRMMCVGSEPAVNENIDPVIMVKKLEKEIYALKHELAMHDTLNNRSQVTYEALSEQQKYDIQQQVQRYLEGTLEEIDIVNIRQIHGVFECFKEYYNSIEREVEERVREKYAGMLEQARAQAISAGSQKAETLGDEIQFVGEPDRQSFGVGVAPRGAKAEPTSVINAKKREMKRKSKERNSPLGTKGPSSPPASQKGEGAPTPHTPSAGGEKELHMEATTPASSMGERTVIQPPRPSTPPNRTAAFEEFRQERGSEIYRILTENKDIFATKKKSYSQLARQINNTKVEIDNSKMRLEALKQEREANGILLNDDGEIIITEEEFLEIKKLKELKHQYKSDYAELKDLKTEVQYCQKLVDQCRQKLIQEFDNWYSESFLDNPDIQTSAEHGFGTRSGILPQTMMEDDGEKFDRLQMELMMENPDSVPYYNAKMRTQRRKTYETAMSQPQSGMRRKPGTPIISVRDKPPTMLQVQ
ncbi:kinesin-like protein KIF9 [Tubulanus polymorphus]|uniref:kinesin-like protein KIF9 n=1 Tax=Tubulanus polymorphus TaxID=672921 RepID=UPI003DA30DFB